jgi:hypothetical protein
MLFQAQVAVALVERQAAMAETEFQVVVHALQMAGQE